MRASALIAIAGLLLTPRLARASCADPTWCICRAHAVTNVFEVARADGGSALPDGGALFDVVEVYGAPLTSPPTSLTLAPSPELVDRALVPDGDTSRVVPLNAQGHPSCKPFLLHDATVLAMLGTADECRQLVAPGWDGQCHDTGCATGGAELGLAALAVLALGIRRRQYP